MKPVISVVMPAYNAAATLEEALESLLAQTETDFELIVVDDGSTDGTGRILAAAAHRDSRVRPHTIPHGGIVAALNHGLAHARGNYLARMDADDLALPRRLELQRALLDDDHTLGLASCLVAHPDPDAPGTEGYARYVDWLNGLVTPEALRLARFVESPLAHPSVMFRRELVERLGGYRDGPFPEDYELWLRWLEAGVAMAKVPEVLLVWRDLPGRLSRTHPRYAVEAFYRLKAAYLARWLARHNPRHPEVVIWGSGKTSRQRAAFLAAEGIHIVAYVDIDPRRRVSGTTPIWHHEQLLSPEQGFVLTYVGKRDARAFIHQHLTAHGFEEERHFLHAA